MIAIRSCNALTILILKTPFYNKSNRLVTMKQNFKSKYTLYIIIAAATLCGCSDDTDEERTSEYKGRAVVFSANTAAQTRTVFGSDANVGRSLLWHNNDEVFISCAQAARGTVSFTNADGTETTLTGVKPWADYAAETATDDAHTVFGVPSDVAGTPPNNYGIRWADALMGYYFYSFYPSRFVKKNTESTSTIVITVPNEQRCVMPTSKDANGVWKLKPDMLHGMMWGRTLNGGTITPVVAGQRVSLMYKPIATVLDITVNNSSGIAQRGLNGIGVAVNGGSNRLAGEFVFNMESGAVTPASGNASTTTKANFVDNKGKNTAVTLSADGTERLNACVFMPLSADVDGGDVVLYFYYNDTNVAATTPKMVRLATSKGRIVSAGKITKVAVTLHSQSIRAEIVSIEEWQDDTDTDISIK